MEHSIQEVARLTGTTSRTLRHYAQIGLLEPFRIGHNGYRYYNAANLIRLQRILLLRELGLGLPQIAQILTSQAPEAAALKTHLGLLREEQERLCRQIIAVQHTIDSLQGSEKLMAQNMFDGFDHTIHHKEVEERWGKDAYARSDEWWRGLGTEGQTSMKELLKELNARWIQAANDPEITADSRQAQDLAQRHVAWLTSIPGTPAADPKGDTNGYILGLARMYVADERFAANYGGAAGAEFVRASLEHFVASKK